jgi:endoglucanase
VRYTERERVLAVVAGVLAVVAAVLLVLYLAPGRTRAPGASFRVRPATPSASLPASAATGVLTAGYAVRGRWDGGFNAEVTVTNIGSQPVAGWTVRLQMPADVAVGAAWSADVRQVSTTVTLRSQPWNTYVAPGAAVHMGFEAKGNAAAPQSCTVNDSPC